MRPSLRLARWMMVLGFCFALVAQATAQISVSSETIDRRVWSLHYWQKLAERGLVEVAKPVAFAPAEQTTSVATPPLDSRDVPVSPLTNITQSENSIFVHPNEINSILNSNNSTSWPVSNLFGASGFMSDDGGVTWRGSPNGTGGSNSGDPATAIDRNGRYFVGYIAANDGQGVARSLNRGQTWTHVQAATTRGGSLLDKNHLWVDNSPTSPFAGNLYSAWTMFGGPNDAEIEIVRSTDGGLSWGTPIVLSRSVNAGSHNQGVNIQTGPNGEVYVMWAIYDSFPADETALGFAISRDGGATFEPARRIITNIRGIRSSGTNKGIRVASFPAMAADFSNSPRRGTLYAVWANRGVPGVNTGNDVDGYMIKSTDNGATWSSPTRINQDASGLGKQHFFHWITCDPANGNVSVIFYDDRNVASTNCETFVTNSADGGVTWSDFRVSDVSFRPSPIPGLAGGYFGDYLGIAALGGKVYPCWTDNRDGRAMTYVSPFILEQDSIPPSPVSDLSTSVPTSNSITLQWTARGDDADSGRAGSYDIRYALAPLDSASFLTATRAANNIAPQAPGALETFEVRGLNFNTTYFFAVKVVDEQGNASPVSNSPSATTLGAPSIAVNPDSLADSLLTGAKVIKTLTVSNIGEGTLDFEVRATGVFEGRTSFALKPKPRLAPQTNFTRTNLAPDETTEGLALPRREANAALVNLPFYDGFEDGNFSDWTDDGGAGVKEVTNSTAAKGQFSFHYNYTGASAHFHGIHQDLASGSQPDYVSFYIRPGASNVSAAYFALTGNGGAQAIFFFARSSGFFYVNADVGGNESFQYNAQQWYHVEFKNIDFVNQRFDYYVEGALVQAGVPFRNAGLINDFEGVYLYNFTSNSEAWWDEIRVGSGGSAPVSWLSVAPDSGRVFASTAFDLQVMFDATGLDGGPYKGEILITSNDPVKDTTRVPVHMQVIGAPDIALSDTALDFGAALVTDTLTRALIVSNLGTDTLETSIAVSSPFAISKSALTLLPRTSDTLFVAFMPTALGTFADSLLFTSDDPDEPRVGVPLRGESLPPPEIGLSPTRFDESLLVGQTSQQTLTITNSGQSDLLVALGFENAQVRLSSLRQNKNGDAQIAGEEVIDAKARAALGEQLLALARAATTNIAFPAKVADDAEGLAPNMRAKFQEQMKPYAELVKRVNQTAAMPSLAVAGFNSTNLLSVLLNLSNSVSDYAYTDVGDNFTLATLASFDGVIVDERDFRLTLVEAQALRDFAASGKPVFIGMDDFDNLTPDVQSVVYPLLGVSAAVDGDFVFGALNPNHPITQDLTRMDFFNSTDNDHFTLAGADWLFSDPANRYFGVAYQSAARTILFGESLFAIVFNSPSNLLLLSNAIDWMVAGSTGWVTVDVTADTLAPETSKNISVTFSAVGLRGGDYTADLVVQSNDPDEKRTVVPVHLVITNAPDIVVESDTLDFGEVYVGTKDSLFATVRNEGTFDLLITSAATSPEVYTVTPPYAGIDPNEKENFKVHFAPTAVGDFSGTLTLTNNDPDENPKIITLLGKGVTPPVIAVAPDSFAFALNSGDSASATMTISNNGGSDLNFTLRDIESGGGTVTGGQYIFWTQEYTSGPDTLFRANLDGTDIRPLYIGNLNSGYSSIAYHPGEGRIYSGEFSEGRLFSMKVDGSDPRILVTGLSGPFDIVLDLGAGHMYWTEFQGGVIKRANLDGSGVSVVVQAPLPGGNLLPTHASKPLFNATNAAALNGPWGLDLDLSARKIYWSEPNSNLISRANFDGTSKEVISSTISQPLGLRLDLSAGKIYFVEAGTAQIKRMDLNGANQELLVQNPATGIADFKLDLAAKKFYWTNYNTDQVLRANIDGSNITPVITRAAFSSDGPFSVGLTGGSGEWLSEIPTQGTVAAGASLPVELKVKSKGLLGGDYRATVFINSNDPFTPEKQASVTLKVTGVPLVEARPDTLRFGEIFITQSGKESVTVTNAGTANLLVANVQTTLAAFAYSDSTQFTLVPGAQRDLTILFTPEAAQSYAAELSFTTNDAKQPQVRIPLLGEGILPPVIAATPDSLCDSLKTGETSTQTLTLRNNGGSALKWSAAVNFSSASRVVSESPRFVSRPLVGVNKHATALLAPRPEEVFTFPTKQDNAFAAKSAKEIDQPNAFEQPLDSTLVKLNRNFAQVNGAIPNRFDFSEGEVGSDINDGGNDMYDGGNILNTNFGSFVPYSNNRIVTSSFFGASGRYFTNKYPGLFILAAELNGVSEFTIDGNLGADGAGNVDGAILETTLFGDDYQGFVRRVFNAGDPSVNHLIIIAKSAAATHEFSTNTDSDFHRVSNLSGTTRLYYLLYAAENGGYIDNAATLNIMNTFLAALELLPEWLKIDPIAGVIPANSSQDVQARFDATGLSGGNYRAQIALTSNDPLTPLLQVPACLNVAGVALIQLSDSTLAFGEVFVGGSKTLSFGVSNTGTDTLHVSNISATTNVFSATPASFKLAPKQEQKVLARFAPGALGEIRDVLTITSNAGNLQLAQLAVNGFGIAPPVIAVSPDSISLLLDADQTATEIVTITNNGGSDLTFSLRDEEQSGAVNAGSDKKLYWSNIGTSRPPSQILRSNLDGSNIETMVAASGTTMRGIAIDEQHARLYWCDSFQRGIFSSTLTGDSARALVSNLFLPIDLALDVEQNKMYWTDFSGGTIGRANLDGSEATVLIAGAANPLTNVDDETRAAKLSASNTTAALVGPFGLTLDLQNRKIYWTEANGNRIGRANLDGTNIETVLSSPNTNGPRGIRLDVANQKIYYLDANVDRVKRADFNGGNVETLVTLSSIAFLELLELDLIEGKMYWSDFGLDNIASANLDGSNLQTIHAAPNSFDSYGVALLNAGWLSESPLSGTIAAGQSENIALTANTKGLAPGNYRATVFINSNDPIDSVKTVSVNLRVRTSDVFLALADTTFGVPRDTINVPVHLDFTAPQVLRTLQAPLKLSNKNLQFFAYTPGPIVPRGLRVQAPASDSVSITFASEGGQYLYQSGVLTTLHFRVADNAAPGAVTALRWLNLTAIDSSGSAPSLGGRNGLFFALKAPEVSGNARYARVTGGGNSAKPVAELEVVLSRNSAHVQTQTTNNAGNYALLGILPRTNYRVEVRRQSGGLGTAISPTDALLAFNGYLGNLTLTGTQNLAADVDGDLAISPGDALAIFNRFLGVTQQYPAADWRAFPAHYAIDGSANAWKTAPTGIDYPVLERDQLNQDYVALARGDVDLSWTSSTSAATAVAEAQGNEPNANAVAFQLVAARSVAGTDRIILPLHLGGVNVERGVYAFGGELQYSAEQLEIVAVHWGEIVPQREFRANYALSKVSSSSEATSAESSNKLAGRLRFGGFASAATAIRRSGALLEIEARVLGNLPAGASLSVQLRETSAALGASAASLQAGASFEAARVSVEQSADLVLAAPATFALLNNYPNPFNPTTELRYQLPEPATVSLTIFNALGQKVRTLVASEKQAGGYYRLAWDAKNEARETVAAGVYFYHLQAHGASTKFQMTKKMLLVK